MHLNLKGLLRTLEVYYEANQSMDSAVLQTAENNRSGPPGEIHHPCPDYHSLAIWRTVKIETLLNKLEDLEQQLEKCKKDKIEQQTIFEEYDLKQTEILKNYSNKISEQEKIILKLKRVAEASHTHD
ncbi:hypothetical protein J6590_088119 [Homalodisca vitripennis]|nr:hypothetical protein J6590_088119 [Homalodisca vitripennis]